MNSQQFKIADGELIKAVVVILKRTNTLYAKLESKIDMGQDLTDEENEAHLAIETNFMNSIGYMFAE
jgi:hypothetical protein